MNAIFPDLGLVGPTNSGEFGLSLFSDAHVDDVFVQQPEVSPPTTTGRPVWVLPTMRRLLQIAMLRRNWDGRGSARVAPDTLVFVFTLLEQSMPPNASAPDMVPLGNGGIQLIWHTHKAELEVEIVKPNEVFVFHLDHTSGAEQEIRLSTQFGELSAIIWDMFRE